MIDIASLPFLVAALCAFLMGFAIQRGATCTVAAISEIAKYGRTSRLRAIAEAALWVAGGLMLARAAGISQALPPGFALSGWTVAGGALLGAGAYITGACVFGAIARLGSGEWAYAFTPAGFLAGAASANTLFDADMPVAVPAREILPLWGAIAFAAYAAWRVFGIVASGSREGRFHARLWSPHVATLVIGITFVILLLVAGTWAYTDLLVQLAAGMADNAHWQLLLFAALLAGAIVGGWAAGLLSNTRPTGKAVLRCLAGGAAMGWGSTLVPGGNDSLILVGIPLLQPHAWAAIITMCATIWLAFALQSRIGGRTP